MQWSKLKKKVEAFFSDSIQGRVELRSTSYRESHDREGRGYITFDKKEIWNMSTISFYPKEYKQVDEIVKRDKIIPYEAQSLAYQELANKGEFNQYGFYVALREYCNNSIEESLSSKSLLIKCIAMLDYRLGKRKLKSLDVSNEHDKVIQFFKIRCQCEGLPFNIKDCS
ncbi:SF0329 family protein [Desulfoluna butyratoxydans]|uniref:SF0329 family protein n=1 Tax=Desulfoluna butyratoxydans TaxID=231438 RepID=UPI0015D385B8|nr:hypothetical protein [Desulfoluna butyratoxydans]